MKSVVLSMIDPYATTAPKWAKMLNRIERLCRDDMAVDTVDVTYSLANAVRWQGVWLCRVRDEEVRSFLLRMSAEAVSMGIHSQMGVTVGEADQELPETHYALWGLDCPATDLALNTVLRDYPSMLYMRDFGTKGGVAISPFDNKRPQFALNNHILLHYSWKVWDRNAFDARLLQQGDEDCHLTFYHEPMGDIDPAEYRRIGEEMSLAISTHPNGSAVRYHGPVLTRYWLDEAGGNPDDFWYPGATAFYFDAYSDSWKGAGYPDPEWMFEGGIRAARKYGVPFGIPELGGPRRTDDLMGEERAAWIELMGAYLQAQPDLISVGWWQQPGWALAIGSPEETAWRGVLQNA